MAKNDFLKYLEVFQVCDSTFPIGSFNHSFGMENYLSDRRITNGTQFREWLDNYYKSQFLHGEGLLILQTYKAIEKGDLNQIKQLDCLISSSLIATETRNGTHLITKQMLRMLVILHKDTIPYLDTYSSWIDKKEILGNPALLFALLSYSKQISADEAFTMYGYSVASTMVQNAVRAVPLGQNDGQIILAGIIQLLEELLTKAKELDSSYLGANTPGIELAQIKHETQEARLFMS
ncbi:MAG: urease accessory protein UreF [Streptococcus salivarius]|nr:urease accessory protein UreF [Streptococcus salivarius]